MRTIGVVPSVEWDTGAAPPAADNGYAYVDASVVAGTYTSIFDKGGDPVDCAKSCSKGTELSAGSVSRRRGTGAANTGLRMERTRKV